MKISVALSKGRLADSAVKLLELCGLNLSNLKVPTRKLVLTDSTGDFEFFFVKPADVPTYVEYGVADIGIVGKDTLLEENKNIYELLDLKTEKCMLCIAGFKDAPAVEGTIRVATKYENIARALFAKKEKNIEILKLNGSVELAPVVGLADVILDIVESGKTLAENNLSVLETVCSISARLVVNKVSLKTKGEVIRPLVQKIEKLVEGRA